MRLFSLQWVSVGLLGLLLAAPQVQAADYTREFLREARNRGYGRVMVEYLTSLKESGQLPSEIKETYDLEMSKALRVAALKDAFNPSEREKWMAESKRLLEKFLTEHADHPEVANAQVTFGDLAMERGLVQIRRSRGTPDKAQQARHLEEARAALLEALPRFEDARDRFQKQFEALQSALTEGVENRKLVGARLRKAQQQTNEAAWDWFDTRLKAGQCQFYVGQTYEDPKNAARIEALKKAASQFDAIYQENRESFLGMMAHAWHGKAVDEAGELELAGDIYEEVLANVPDNPASETDLAEMFAQVFHFKALLTIKKGEGETFAKTAPDWLKTYRAWRKTNGYQGICLEYARARLAAAENASSEEKRKTLSEVNKILREMATVASEFQDDALLLAKDLRRQAGEDTEAGSVAEAMALAADAATSQEWAAAESGYQKALKMAQASAKANEKKEIPAIEALLDQVRYRRAVELYGEGQYAEVVSICGKVAANAKSETGPAAGALAVNAALMVYVNAPDAEAKEKALNHLTQVAEYTVKTWPDKPEADDARIAMGQAKLVQGQIEEAISVFEKVNPRSERYGNALFLAGQNHWRIYLQVEKPDAEKGPPRADKAQAALVQSVEFLRKQRAENPEAPPPTQLAEAELLLGEVYVERGDFAKALELLTPLTTEAITKRPSEVTNVVLRLFLATVKANLGAGNLQQAADVSLALMEFAPDDAHINRILAGFVTLMINEWKSTNARLIEVRSGNDLAARQTATTQYDLATNLLGKLIEKFLARTQVEVRSQLVMARTAMDIERPDLGEPLYKALLEKADAGDSSVPPQAVPAIRSALIGIVRRKGDFQEALDQADKLLAANPNVLEFMMERGRILQDWSETDDSKLNEAVQHWVSVRTKLESMRQKPSEYYEVNYNAALCLYKESQKLKDPSKASDAAKLLNALLFRNPKLNGPDTVAKYNELLKKVTPESTRKPTKKKK